MLHRIDDILDRPALARDEGEEIGRSREGRAVFATRCGRGRRRVSVIAGCHADEPVGPRFLRQLVPYLRSLPPDDPLVSDLDWWIVPHINPDGEARNRGWHGDDDTAYDLVRYLAQVVREVPGDDVEFGFPRDARDVGARPENRAVHDWWRSSADPLALHVSLHGMAHAAGPWFLIEAAWIERSEALMSTARATTVGLGYELHDVERHGEKGFVRIARGFCTRPDSRAMVAHFEGLGDDATASLFRPSSMETARSLGGDPLTLVSEMPLFITPGVGEELGPPDPAAELWKTRLTRWRARLAAGERPDEISAEAQQQGLTAMPVRDQMHLQWCLICAGLACVSTTG